MGTRVNIPDGEYLQGLSDIVSKIQTELNKLDESSAQGLLDALLFVATESQNRAPVDTGDLRGSLEVSIDGITYASGVKGGGIIAVSGKPPANAAGGKIQYTVPYAANQHEQINYDHPHGGQAKYLESVLVENQDRILQLIAKAITGGD